MCNFLSLVSDGHGKIMYFDWEKRKRCLNGELNYQPDSHTSIAEYYGYRGRDEDLLNKYEYNPISKTFKIDGLSKTKLDDSKEVEAFCRQLDFKTVVQYVDWNKKIVNPFVDIKTTKVTKQDIELVKKWDSFSYSVRNSVLDSVGDSVSYSVRNFVLDSVGYSVRNSVRDSVGYSVRDSVWDFISAYISSFFTCNKWKYVKHKKGVNPFQPVIDLWNNGLVPSFDGKLWRLHGYKGKVLWEGKV